MFENKTENNEQVTIQGCISADQCRLFDDERLQCCEGDFCNTSKYHDGYRNAKMCLFRRTLRFSSKTEIGWFIKRKIARS